MSQSIIRIAGVAKQYRLGTAKQHQTMRGTLNGIFSAPVRLARSLGKKGPAKRGANTFWALKDVSFDVQPGEVVGLIGRNGSGKSTLLKILSRITEPTLGRIELRGRVGSLLEVGTGFHPELTGRENIYLNGAILGMTKAEIQRKFDEIVTFAEVAKFVDTPVKFYSSGMYLRLAFSVAAHLESEILIVDEVLAVGDASFQKKCLGRMSEVSRGGRTVIFVSHNMAAVKQLTTKGVVLRQGQVAFAGDTATAIEHYLSSEEDLSNDVYEVGVHGYHPRGFPGTIEFVRLQLAEHTNKMLESDQDLVILTTLKGNTDVPRFRLNVTIVATDGTPAGTAFSPECLSIEDGQTSIYEFRLKHLGLSPGTYYCTLAVGLGTPETGILDYDAIEHVLHFEVLGPGNEDGTTTCYWAPHWGGVRFPSATAMEVSYASVS